MSDMDSNTYQILINHSAGPRSQAVLNLLRRAGIQFRAKELTTGHLPDDVPGCDSHDLILLFTDSPGQNCELLLRQLQSSRRDIPCLLICRTPSRWLSMLSLGAAALINETQLETPTGQVQFVYQIKRELEHLNLRRQFRRASSSIRELHQRLQLFTDHTTDAVATLQGGLHQYANNAWLSYFGFRNHTELHATPFLDLVADEDADRVRAFMRQPFNNGMQRCEFMAIRRDGSEILTALDSASISVNGEQSLQLMVQAALGNATHQNAVREAMSQDLQSGLLNDRGFHKVINQAISSAVYQGRSSALILMTAPQLAEISVVLGKTDTHILLRDIASVLASKCPEPAILGRLDDGDFAVLLPDADTEACQSTLMRLDTLETALQAMAPQGLSLSFRSGAAMVTDEAPDAETLLIRARQHQIIRQHQVYTNGPVSIDVLTPLRQSLRDENLLLVYQPTVSLRTDPKEFYEVRIRVPIADRMIYPNEFLQIANQHGYGERLDRYVISHALRTLNNQKNPQLCLTVNLTSNTLLSQTFAVWLAQELKRQEQSAKSLILQFSEMDVMGSPDQVRLFCQRLRELGFELSLSHFGCSLDPFRLLGQLPVDFVKLDRSLWQQIDIDLEQRERLQEVIRHLHAQGIRVIAPMVEDVELLPLLWQANINFVQGNCLQQPSDLLEFGLFQEQRISLPQPDQHSETL
ncbi:MAG: sensor domain-containing phosphodiesterase [Pseudomonadota bacterium]|nr:hypothetical protein [Gammaproteobacteria bacterium]MEC8860513.1 sensor domain-containing phosphodiesterase [Pseudomonadota bacterium]HBN14444.1 hypothetical protein [Pseudohongiella sp.]|tara:strand:+ start:317 stop:2401 length:2085 start_codon:yes stop_codon:yes gene_type:complete